MPRSPGRQLALDAYRRREGAGLESYATWCALTEAYGPMQDWPAGLEHPAAPAVAEFAAGHARAIEFHCWLQWLLDAQLGQAQDEAVGAGMALGIMHDLAVGVHPFGADAWALQDTYARGIQVGAPPDPYNQNGQNWSQPPWRPDRLAETGYEPFRRMVSAVLGTPAGSGSTTSSGCSGCGGSPMVMGRRAGRTSATTTRR